MTAKMRGEEDTEGEEEEGEAKTEGGAKAKTSARQSRKRKKKADDDEEWNGSDQEGRYDSDGDDKDGPKEESDPESGEDLATEEPEDEEEKAKRKKKAAGKKKATGKAGGKKTATKKKKKTTYVNEHVLNGISFNTEEHPIVYDLQPPPGAALVPPDLPNNVMDIEPKNYPRPEPSKTQDVSAPKRKFGVDSEIATHVGVGKVEIDKLTHQVSVLLSQLLRDFL